jgi:hypothetical protein
MGATGVTNEILERFLSKLAEQEGLSGLEAAGDWLIYRPHGWNEVGVRARLYGALAPLLQAPRIDVPAVLQVVANDADVLSGHVSVKTRTRAFVKDPQAEALVMELVGNRSSPPAPVVIELFIDRAVERAFHTPEGVPDRSGAALLASTLLTAVHPGQFVDYRLGRWRIFSRLFDLPAPSGSTDGELLYWAGDVAGAFAATSAFQHYLLPAATQRFGIREPNWVTSGLAFLLREGTPLHPLLKKTRQELPTISYPARVAKMASRPPAGRLVPTTPQAKLQAVYARLARLKRHAEAHAH